MWRTPPPPTPRRRAASLAPAARSQSPAPAATLLPDRRNLSGTSSAPECGQTHCDLLNSPIDCARGWTARGRSSQTPRRIATERPCMSATVTSLLVAGGVFLAGYCALVFFPKLPTHRRTNETRDVVRLGIGIVSLLTSLVLGLLIASAKSTFDTNDSQMRSYAADFIVLDQTL